MYLVDAAPDGPIKFWTNKAILAPSLVFLNACTKPWWSWICVKGTDFASVFTIF